MKYVIKNADGSYVAGAAAVHYLKDATLFNVEPLSVGETQTVIKVEIESLREVPQKRSYSVEKTFGPPLMGCNYVWGIRGLDNFKQPAIIAYCDDKYLAERLATLANLGDLRQ